MWDGGLVGGITNMAWWGRSTGGRVRERRGAGVSACSRVGSVTWARVRHVVRSMDKGIAGQRWEEFELVYTCAVCGEGLGHGDGRTWGMGGGGACMQLCEVREEGTRGMNVM